MQHNPSCLEFSIYSIYQFSYYRLILNSLSQWKYDLKCIFYLENCMWVD